MMKLMRDFQDRYIEKMTTNKEIPEFRTGDNVAVYVKIVEGASEREQIFEGLCVSIRRKALNSSFTIRKISNGIGVERVFMTYSPRITVKVVRRGKVRRAKLYYIRKLSGKAARIKERKKV